MSFLLQTIKWKMSFIENFQSVGLLAWFNFRCKCMQIVIIDNLLQFIELPYKLKKKDVVQQTTHFNGNYNLQFTVNICRKELKENFINFRYFFLMSYIFDLFNFFYFKDVINARATSKYWRINKNPYDKVNVSLYVGTEIFNFFDYFFYCVVY